MSSGSHHPVSSRKAAKDVSSPGNSVRSAGTSVEASKFAHVNRNHVKERISIDLFLTATLCFSSTELSELGQRFATHHRRTMTLDVDTADTILSVKQKVQDKDERG